MPNWPPLPVLYEINTAVWLDALSRAAQRRLTLGTVAAAHTSGAAVALFDPPSLVEQLTVAYTLDQREQESSAYARTIGSASSRRNADQQLAGSGIPDLEKRVLAAYGRQLRHRAVG